MSNVVKTKNTKVKTINSFEKKTLKIDGYTFNNINEKNVRGFYNMMNKISLMTGNCHYNDNISPIENMKIMINYPFGMTWEVHGDWEDYLNGVFDQYINETEQQHINRTLHQMIMCKIDSGFSIHDGNSFTFQKRKHFIDIEKNNCYFCCIDLHK